MEARELKDMTAVLRSINDGNPSNAERWVNLTQRVIRAEYRANTAERAAARKDWEKQNAEDDARMARCRVEEAKLAARQARENASLWRWIAVGMGIALTFAVAFGTHEMNEAARWRYEAQGMGQTEIVTPQNQNTAVQP